MFWEVANAVIYIIYEIFLFDLDEGGEVFVYFLLDEDFLRSKAKLNPRRFAHLLRIILFLRT